MIIIDKETVFAISILQSYDFFSEHRLRLPKKCCLHFEYNAQTVPIGYIIGL